MAKNTLTKRLRDAQARLGIAEAQSKMSALRDANKARKEMLATYAAADRGRRNKDWRAPAVSADVAIIPDLTVLIGRVRQMERDSWIVTSAIDAYCRNVVGCGVIPIPQAKDAKGKLLTNLNRDAMLDFWEWAGDKQWCDVEADQTFWQMEDLAERERVTAGEAFWIWSYTPNRLPNGKIDLSQPVGLKIQAVEAEQLDLNMVSYTDPVTREVREVRGGVEVDGVGRAVAFHIYTTNPNDFGWMNKLKSIRVDAGRVLHYFKKKRVKQKRGVTPLASVLQDARDLTRHKEAQLWRNIMEACIGATVKREITAPGSVLMPGIQPRMAGDTGATASGMPTIDFVPGMVADPGAGITLEPYIPQAPGNGYEPFQRLGLRGVAAGAGLSYGPVSRDYTQGTYSGQRQEMLEDRKVFEPLQEMLAHNLLFPVYRIFFALSVAEGRLDAPGFESSPMRYTAAEYIAPPPTWIDPKAEADALEKLIELRVITREEIAHLRGTRLADILDKIAAERDEAKSKGILFEENVGMEATEADANQKNADAKAKNATAKVTLNPPAPPAAPALPPSNTDQSKAIVKMAEAVVVMAGGARKTSLAQLDAPNYRIAAVDVPVNCAACRFYHNGKCTAYDFLAAPDHVCDAFETKPAAEMMGGKITGALPVANPDDFSIDNRADRGVQ